MPFVPPERPLLLFDQIVDDALGDISGTLTGTPDVLGHVAERLSCTTPAARHGH
ncbi:MAG: hypothetical protein GKC06_06700 [Methanomicrobiales archaeon]|nr:hypothetical protein [Methanomicrobiales archaeon]